ncbi:MAG: heavy metal translocating P-type ATPase metal-binding domain-containing protein [Chitinophagales bacterium]|nr:heavy metal translocating P-type ATPase metal-binding domain-containing protein [Chitinophagales bacterium]MCB9020615.1 heavy metal translocating P-type ATPase metal-binding domain-containing protein [Chitinophagales bacterium]HPE98507.1 heavy metal translocating P-type ATPase metal-binding domain-containing protein [Chitinophagales bacterium]HQU39525.1 heavy metal translocating P-type ATPase metal-binding domain-containing protein [Chitinophagales bacterium]HQU76370.1 heavy metal translocat
MARQGETTTRLTCYHCGEDCTEEVYYVDEKPFCCFGCKTVYGILADNDLCAYYELESAPGKNRRDAVETSKYEILDRPDIRARFVTFEDARQMHMRFYLPHMHCSSCIWLLENLHTLHPAVAQARVDFRRKEITIIAAREEISVREVASLLDTIGYEPYLSLQDMEKKDDGSVNRGRLIRMAVAGFCFGNIMLFSAPEYLAGGAMGETSLRLLFQYLSLLFSLPVFFYCADEFYISSWKSLRKGFLHIDVPIALAIIITFVRSLYTVFVEGSGGYFDSMSGIVFFMLLGRYFQDRTYKMVSFTRDYKSYFPLSATKLEDGKEEAVAVTELQKGDTYIVRNNELIPADSILIRGQARIDYSFVTGEAEPVEKSIGELIYAGGRQRGSHLELRVIKEVSQSYLTQLWNQSGNRQKQDEESRTMVQLLSKHFSLIVLILSVMAFIFWLFMDPSRSLDALVTPMIIACPCALLLSATFTNGNAIARLGKAGLYLRNAGVIEKLTRVSVIVFDKTGTITPSRHTRIEYEGTPLQSEERSLLSSLVHESSHPYSRAIATWCGTGKLQPVRHFREIAGSGIEGEIGHTKVRLMRAPDERQGTVFLVNGEELGMFRFSAEVYPGMFALTGRLRREYPIYLLSGDSDRDKPVMDQLFDGNHQRYYCQPEDKRRFIEELQKSGEVVMMVGDGLNDAGALMQSDVGVAVTDDIHSFTPASDLIMEVQGIGQTDRLLRYAAAARKVIIWSFVISLIYNVAGLWFALQGLLQPVIAAILMPLSTITIVLFTTGLTSLFSRRLLRPVAGSDPE